MGEKIKANYSSKIADYCSELFQNNLTCVKKPVLFLSVCCDNCGVLLLFSWQHKLLASLLTWSNRRKQLYT